MKEEIFKILPLVSKPSRYIGAEVNSCAKDPAEAGLRVALCFPDVYEVGISHLGLKVLYEALNARTDIYAERSYSPWPDMEAILRERGLPLFTLETFTPLSEMDIIGFTLQYELSYTNVLNMLSLSGLPLMSKDRDERYPLVIAGGPCALNPEPLADFIDLFVIGDAEEAVLEIADAAVARKKAGGDRGSLLRALAGIEGVYVPSHFEVRKKPDGTVAEIVNVAGGPDRVKRRVVEDLDAAAYPARPLLPYMAAVHNRVTLEVARGCSRGCRFCQAGMIYRPARERNPGTIVRIIREALGSTGYDDVTLLSLSSGDYTLIEELLAGLMEDFVDEHVALSLPSLRVGTLSERLASEIK
ncbi:MAG TPA: radical SAM protein, partial [Nitrospirota bacterium]|nr:radical SAM protein [Nitrospirota bacterium]